MGHKIKKLALLTGYLLLTASHIPANAMDHSGRTKHDPASSETSVNTPADRDPFAAGVYPVSYEITGPSPSPANGPAVSPYAAPGGHAQAYAPAAPAQPSVAPNGAVPGYTQFAPGGQVILQPQAVTQLPLAYPAPQVVGYAVVNGQIVTLLGTPQPVLGLAGQTVITQQPQPVYRVMPNGSLVRQHGQALPQIIGQKLPAAPVQAAPAPNAQQSPEGMPEDLLRALPSAGGAAIESQASKEVLPDLPTASLRGLVVNVGKKNGTTAAMRVAGATGAPIGYVQFCRENRSECRDKTSSPGIVKLSRALWNEVVAINSFVNGAIEPVTDEELYNTAEKWTFPKAGRGDCEDYVLLKRRLLMERGWPASALLITVVRDENGGHAVLTVRTDQGDFILDNQESKVLAWYQTPYRFIKRQSEAEAKRWVSIRDDRPFNVGSLRN